MGPRILLVNSNPAECALISGILGQMKAQAEIIEDRADVGELIQRRKFAGIILDGKLIGRRRLELVHRIRRSPSNSKTPIVLILDPQDTSWLMDAYRAGVTFSVIRPLGEKKLNQLLTLAGGSMLAEQRSYIRLPASLPVRFLAGKKSGQGQSINISCSGLLFRTSERFSLGDNLDLEIEIAGPARIIAPRGKISRLDSTERVALHFTDISVDDREELRSFLQSCQAVDGPSART